MASKDSTGKYLLDGVGDELRRLQLQHKWIMRCTDGKIIWAPLDLKKENLKILDVGCADGSVFRDLQKLLPASAQFTGGDITESFFPATAPPNTTFMKVDITKSFPASLHGAFDLTHVRYAMASGGAVGVHGMLDNLIESLRPGGWLQVAEMLDVPEGRSPIVSASMAIINTLLEMIGMKDFSKGLEQAFKDKGLVGVRSEVVELRAGAALGNDETTIAESVEPWVSSNETLINVYKNMGAELPPGVQGDFLEKFRKELTEKGGSTWNLVVYGQKKEE